MYGTKSSRAANRVPSCLKLPCDFQAPHMLNRVSEHVTRYSRAVVSIRGEMAPGRTLDSISRHPGRARAACPQLSPGPTVGSAAAGEAGAQRPGLAQHLQLSDLEEVISLLSLTCLIWKMDPKCTPPDVSWVVGALNKTGGGSGNLLAALGLLVWCRFLSPHCL